MSSPPSPPRASPSSPPPPPPPSQPPLADALRAARRALHQLLDAGVSLSDARVETLLTLLLRAAHAHHLARPFPAHPSTPPRSTPSLARHAQHHLRRAAERAPANHFNCLPHSLAPVGRSLPGSAQFSFQEHNQVTIAAATAALERFDHPTPASPAPPSTPGRPHPHVAPPFSLHHSIASPSPPTTPPLPPFSSVFNAARQLHTESIARRPPSKRKDPKVAPRTSSPRAPQSPRLRRGHQAPSFEAQTCGDLSATHVFQVKAQLDAFRRLIRDADIPAEVHIAARGRPPTCVLPASGYVIERGVPDPHHHTLVSDKPSIHPNGISHFDVRNLPRFPINHTFTKQDVLRNKEEHISDAQVQERVALAKAHHQRLYARFCETHSTTPLSPTAPPPQLDARVAQQRLEIIHAASAIAPIPSAKPSESSHPHKPLHERKSPRRRERGLPAIHTSIVRNAAAVPICVVSKGQHRPSYLQLLREREERLRQRMKFRLQEINEIKTYAPDEVQRLLKIEEKQLKLTNLQRSVREKVMYSMKAVLDRRGISDLRPATIARWRRRAAGYAYGNSISHGSYIGAPRVEESYRIQQAMQRRARRQGFMQNLLHHGHQFKVWFSARQTLKKRLLKDLERYFRDRSREEERRKKKEQLDRLRALRSNNQDEYLELLKATKNKRLIQLLKQTDEYLMQIGAQVERQKRFAREEDERLGGGHQEADRGTESEARGANAVYPGEADDELTQFKKRRNDYYTISHTISEKVRQPDCLVGGKLKHYQLEGLEWLVSLYNNNLNGILADEMGLGKTIQTLSLITYLCEVKKTYGPFLIIVPLSVISNWVREMDKWAPSLIKVVYKGDPGTRKCIQLYEMQGGNYNVLLTTYEFVVKDKNVLGRIRWKYIIMDEGHRMKNADCKLALTLGAKYTSRNRLLLTGTPLQNNMTELWALLNFLLPTIFSSAETFETWFNAPFQDSSLGESAELNEEENLLIISRLHQVLRPFMLRRLKTDVESQLPDKVELVFKCDMSVWQKVLYRQLQRRLGVSGGSGNVGIRSFNNMVMQLKKVCNHPYLFYQEDELMSLPSEYLMRVSGKFELLDHCLRKLKKCGHRVLIFSQMTAALDFLEYFLQSIDMKYLRLDGTTKADDRQEMLEMFNAENSEYFCFLLSTRAGGLGLNLQTADTVIIFDSDWNPMMDLQAQDRAHRIGQTKEVRVYRLICSGSIEEKILKRANRKLLMDAQVIQAGQFNNKSSDNDRQEMLKDLLRQQTGDDISRKEDVTSLSEINRKLARSDEELEVFEEIDAELESQYREGSRLLTNESELPSWVLLPEVEEKHKEHQSDFSLEHGRGRRKRKEITYDDNLTEREWAIAMEEEGDVAEAARRKRRRLVRNSRKTPELSNGDSPYEALPPRRRSIARDSVDRSSRKQSSEDLTMENGRMNGNSSAGRKDVDVNGEGFDGAAREAQKPRRKRGRPRKNPRR